MKALNGGGFFVFTGQSEIPGPRGMKLERLTGDTPGLQ
jgi:hypothetical protein